MNCILSLYNKNSKNNILYLIIFIYIQYNKYIRGF